MSLWNDGTHAARIAAQPISSVIGKYVDLRPAGREMVGHCPFHDDKTPSFYVNDEKGVFHCFGCDAAGDEIDFVRKHNKVGFADALAELQGSGNLPMRRLVNDNPANRNLEIAKQIWNEVKPIQGSPAEAYLASRGFPNSWLPESMPIGFARLPFNGSNEKHPALVAALQTRGGEFAGVQRTFLREDGTKLDPKRSKMSLGNIKRNSIQLGEAAERIIICEGLEDGLTLSMLGEPVWVAAGADMLKSIALPPVCRHVVIAADNDEAGRRAAEKAATYFCTHGRHVTVMHPLPMFKDFNEMHCAKVAEHLKSKEPSE